MHQIDLSRVDLNLLVTLDVLMQEGSVTRAARRLGRTQSAVIAVPEPFDPIKSQRVLRIAAPDMSQAVMAGIIRRV
jgi:hypothetical protein